MKPTDAAPAPEVGREPVTADEFWESWWPDANFAGLQHILQFAEAYAESRLSTVVEALREAVEWNADYKRINHLSGNPNWVERAEAILQQFPPEPKP